MNIRTFEIDVDIYNYSFLVCIGPSNKSIDFINDTHNLPNLKEVGYDVKDLDDFGGGVFTEDNKYTILWLPSIPKTSIQLSDLAHEIFHVVCQIMNRVSIPLTISSEEAYCYLIGYITKEFWRNVKN